MPSADAIIDESAASAVEERELVRFERAQEYLSLLSQLVASNNTPISDSFIPSVSPNDVLGHLVAILDEYQDQSHLLDPYLEQIVSPPVEALQRHVRSLSHAPNIDGSSHRLTPGSVSLLSKLIYAYTKVRGHKTILHYFPHEVADLPATLAFLESLQQFSQESCWESRYVTLLWLSLICMIPFDLAKFDLPGCETKATTASRIAAVGEGFLANPGKERDAAAVVLGRLFQRSDVLRQGYFGSFLKKSQEALSSQELSPFHATGILQALCEILKTSEPAFVSEHIADIQAILDVYDTPENAVLVGNALVLKYQTKLVGRLAAKIVPPRSRRRHGNKVLVLGYNTASSFQDTEAEVDDEEDESDVPEETEYFISYLIEALQHKDTIVRYSAAKGLARLCDRLPTSFLTQVVEAIISLFQINIPDLNEGAKDLSSVSEHTWQGTCMALAELSRRGLLHGDMLSEALPWILKALLFDVRRGAHSVGANVRDAACYVVWALARSNDVESIRPHAMELAKRLVAVATLDRDVSIRRAASAAFQESVGRLGLFPHGIDVIRMTDFYAVSVRRSAFLECSVKVAGFDEYRGYLLDHLVEVVTLHWDASMRKLGAKAVASITMHDPSSAFGEITARLARRVGSPDVAVLHGTIVTIAEMCRISRTLNGNGTKAGEEMRAQAFGLLDSIRPSVFRPLGAASILEAACQLIGAAFPPTITLSGNEIQTWERILNLALARQEEFVHAAAAEAVAQLSASVDVSSKIHNTVHSWSSLTLAQQQSNALLLGAVAFKSHGKAFGRVIHHLINLGKPSTKVAPNPLYSDNVEVRRNAADSMTRAVIGLQEEFAEICGPELLQKVIASMLTGLEDYSMDQRGDVGSWVRLSCIAGLRELLTLLSRQEVGTGLWLPEATFQLAIAAMWKQAAERIDHVRHTAGTSVLAVYHAYEQSEGIKPLGYDIVKLNHGTGCLRPFGDTAISSAGENGNDANLSRSFKDPKLAFVHLCQLLLVVPYRKSILEGLVLSVGSKSDLGERIIGPALTCLTTKSSSAPSYTLIELLTDIFDLAKSKFGDNRIFIPAINTVNLLLENGAHETGVGDVLMRLTKMATTNVAKIKSIPRLVASAGLCANLVLVIGISDKGESRERTIEMLMKATETFLTHTLPTVRVKMAEQLYAVLSTRVTFDQDEVQEQVDEDREGRLELWQELEMALLDTKWGATTGVDGETVHSLVAALPRVLA
ncbi:related to Tubulin-folding cofactor D [Melanopsichium pennsylvanicum]|uniref:Related to Tubulin-folding cofactor D n=2 Tax=Melanopsichium pennsylvanicum TaxID=63383 RepID=A0AAJ5C2M6_9BASI|nr:related to Tubulin-folding cofactor D [Melanopsichium pennsylvanicum 4]SNX81662.1 related to Tubulin-folding cofactor D [Melanopsichium pennsylvanicum]